MQVRLSQNQREESIGRWYAPSRSGRPLQIYPGQPQIHPYTVTLSAGLPCSKAQFLKPTWQVPARKIPVGQRLAARQRSHPREAVANAEVLRRRV